MIQSGEKQGIYCRTLFRRQYLHTVKSASIPWTLPQYGCAFGVLCTVTAETERKRVLHRSLCSSPDVLLNFILFITECICFFKIAHKTAYFRCMPISPMCFWYCLLYQRQNRMDAILNTGFARMRIPVWCVRNRIQTLGSTYKAQDVRHI